MFEIKRPISRNSKTDLEDTARVKLALTSLGHYDDTETGLSPYADNQFFHSVKNFQKENGLKVDGVINPEGETHTTLKKKLSENTKAGNAFGDFWKNFNDMNETRLDGGDKYFHCKANYEATDRGWFGELSANALSDVKELKDQRYSKHSQSDVDADQNANKHGRNAAKSGKYNSAQEACAIFRPQGLDEKY